MGSLFKHSALIFLYGTKEGNVALSGLTSYISYIIEKKFCCNITIKQ